MLVLTRGKEEAIMIGHDIEIKVLDIRGDRVRLGIVAPPHIAVHRQEVYLAIQKENVEAARSESSGLDEAVKYLGKGKNRKQQGKGSRPEDSDDSQ